MIELKGLQGKNASVIKHMRNRITLEQAEFDLSGAKIHAVRSVHLKLLREVGGALTQVRVIIGEALALLDNTGTLTGKYQARLTLGEALSELIATADTDPMLPLVGAETTKGSPTDFPQAGRVLPIAEIYARLQQLIGRSFPDAGIDQERNRGAALHRLVCQELGYADYADDGQFPDIKAEALEVKSERRASIPSPVSALVVTPLSSLDRSPFVRTSTATGFPCRNKASSSAFGSSPDSTHTRTRSASHLSSFSDAITSCDDFPSTRPRAYPKESIDSRLENMTSETSTCAPASTAFCRSARSLKLVLRPPVNSARRAQFA